MGMTEFWVAMSEMDWPWPYSMTDEQLQFFALGWPGCEPISGVHIGPKSRITIRHYGEIKTFEIDFASRVEFPESNVREVRKYPIQWEGASPELARQRGVRQALE